MEELRAALKSHSVDEQCEEYTLDATIDIDAELPDENAHQQRSGDTTKYEASDLELSNEVTERNGQKEREQWLCGQQFMQ